MIKRVRDREGIIRRPLVPEGTVADTQGASKDFMIFDATWNAVDLGWRENMAVETLASKFILHWNGKRKPWHEAGVVKMIFSAHFYDLRSTKTLRPPQMTIRHNLEGFEVLAQTEEFL